MEDNFRSNTTDKYQMHFPISWNLRNWLSKNSAKEPPFVVIISIQMTTQGQVCIPLCSICSIWRDIRRQIRRMICRSIPWRWKITFWDPRNARKIPRLLHLSLQQNPRSSWQPQEKKRSKWGVVSETVFLTSWLRKLPWLRRPCKRQAQAGNFKQHGLLARGSYIMSKFLTINKWNISKHVCHFYPSNCPSIFGEVIMSLSNSTSCQKQSVKYFLVRRGPFFCGWS